MKAINIYVYTRIQSDLATEYENILGECSDKSTAKKHEFLSLVELVDELSKSGVTAGEMDGFFVSFSIKQIGKEFDLLKIEEDSKVLNIELKSEDVGEREICEQLQKNRCYLSHIAPAVHLYTFVSKTKQLYCLDDDGLNIRSVEIRELKKLMESFNTKLENGVENLFRASNYLISPLNSPEKFLKGGYFLTPQQKGFKREIIENEKENVFFGITGKAGTGKTLLLYDIAKEKALGGCKCCVVHSGMLCEGHKLLNSKINGLTIYAAKDIGEEKIKVLSSFEYIFVDEIQRIYLQTFQGIVEEVLENKKVAIFSYDFEQIMANAEISRDIKSEIDVLKDRYGFREFKLSNTIRTSREIATFCRELMDLRQMASGYMDYSKIDVLYTNNTDEADEVIRLYKSKNYRFISYTPSSFYKSSLDKYKDELNTHQVIGQEFDNVLIMMDDNFRYDSDGRIQGRTHPNPDYLFYKLMYQAISRAREKLCILVVGNYELFKQVLGIKYRMLERYQFKESRINGILSLKKLNGLTKKVKDIVSEIDAEDGKLISESVDMINDDLRGAEMHRKIISCGINLLILTLCNMKNSEVEKAVKDYCEYIKEIFRLCEGSEVV